MRLSPSCSGWSSHLSLACGGCEIWKAMKASVLANPFRIELRSDVAYGLPTKWTQCANRRCGFCAKALVRFSDFSGLKKGFKRILFQWAKTNYFDSVFARHHFNGKKANTLWL